MQRILLRLRGEWKNKTCHPGRLVFVLRTSLIFTEPCSTVEWVSGCLCSSHPRSQNRTQNAVLDKLCAAVGRLATELEMEPRGLRSTEGKEKKKYPVKLLRNRQAIHCVLGRNVAA